MNDMKAP